MSKYDAPHYSFVVGGTRSGAFLILSVHSKGTNFEKGIEEYYLIISIVDNPYNYKQQQFLGSLWEVEKKFTEKDCVFDSFEKAYNKLFEIGEKYGLEKVL